MPLGPLALKLPPALSRKSSSRKKPGPTRGRKSPRSISTLISSTAWFSTKPLAPPMRKKEKAWCEIPTENMIEWATKELDPEIHLIVIEATSNTFDSVTKLTDKGFSSIVVESNQVSKVSDAFLDSDQIAAERIGRCYLTGLAKVVWVPDEKTRERREILHAYNKSVTDCTRANNELKSYLTGFNVRPGKRNLMLEEHRDWVRKKLPMTPTRGNPPRRVLRQP